MPVTQYHGNVELGPITTCFCIVNNGSAVGHDVHIKVYFDAHSYDIYSEQYIPEIEQNSLKIDRSIDRLVLFCCHLRESFDAVL